MAGIGIGLLWVGYWLGLSGVSLLKGWNNSPWSLANPVKLATFTTDCYVGSGIIPTGDPGDSGACGGSSSGPSQTQRIQQQQAATAKNQGRPNPGSVQGRL